MNHAKLLDCTLRDGAYLIDKEFGDTNIYGIIDGLVKARIDIIEVGFFQNDGFGEGKTVFLNSIEAKKYIPSDKQGKMFAVLADYSRYNIDNLDRCDGTSIDVVRECFFKKERFAALDNCKRIKKMGYKCFVQPVDILGYTDVELIELLNLVNEVEPYCFSIVDTFGSIYQEDLYRIFELIHHNLVSGCRIGFHSHNNMQMSNSLSQEFIRMSYGKREIVVDGTISGMGRGAGNAPTELIAQYLVSKREYNYDIDALLDIINDYMDNIKTRCSWGYTTPFFVAGAYSAHVNNIVYLTQKNSIRYRDIRYILNKIGETPRKRYDYDLLEKTYLAYLDSDIDDKNAIERLKKEMFGRNILILFPGMSVSYEINKIQSFIEYYNPKIISINYVNDNIESDYVYFSNTRRYSTWVNDRCISKIAKILTSNIKNETNNDNELIISFNRLIKCGWEHLDNSGLMLLRLLDLIDVNLIGMAGFDGYHYSEISKCNYVNEMMELSNVRENPGKLNDEISSMLNDYIATRGSKCPVMFVTNSRFLKTTPIEKWRGIVD